MKRGFGVLLLCISVLSWGSVASAVPLDLSGFTADPGASESGGTISFIEDIEYGALYFFNDFFLVPDDATILSFDYEIGLGQQDNDDYLTFDAYDNTWSEITYNEFPEFAGGDLAGHFAIDLFPHQGTHISLAWGFIEGDFDTTADSLASVYNIDLASASAAPVPEPCTVLLVGTGLVGLVGLGRKKLFGVS